MVRATLSLAISAFATGNNARLVPHRASLSPVGGEELFYIPDLYDNTIEFIITPTIKPEAKQELFIFVNDAVIGIPGLYDLLYRDNRGTASLTVERTR